MAKFRKYDVAIRGPNRPRRLLAQRAVQRLGCFKTANRLADGERDDDALVILLADCEQF